MALSTIFLLSKCKFFENNKTIDVEKNLIGTASIDAIGFITTLVIGILGFTVFHFPLPLSISLVSVSGLIIGSWVATIAYGALEITVFRRDQYVS